MPRSAYGDKYTVSVNSGDKKVAFDFTSKVVDFITITNTDPESGNF